MRLLSPDVPQHLRFQIFLLSHFVFGSGWSQEELQHHREVSSSAVDSSNGGQGVFSDPYDPSSAHFRHDAGGGGGGHYPPNPYNEYPHQHHRQQSQQVGQLGLEREQLEPQFLIKGQKITAKLGDTVVLPCKVANLGDSSHTTVLWKQGERVITAGAVKVRKDGRLSMAEASSLKISGVGVADTGNYTCEVEWSGEPKQIVHYLEIQVPPQIEAVLPGSDNMGRGLGSGMGLADPMGGMVGHHRRPLEAREGSSIDLECRADGIPPPIIRWRRPSGDYSRGSSVAGLSQTSMPKGPVLRIPNVLKDDAGTYICTASNGVGSMSADQIELRVLFPPEVTSAERTVHAWPGGRADLTCIVRAEPRATITWYLDGQRVLADSRHQLEEHDTLAALRLRELQIRDMGNYSCQAENSQGRARDHIELSGKPETASINSSPEGLYRHSYNLTWTVRSREPLSEVRLLFRKLDQPTNYNVNHASNGTWNNILLRVPSFWQQQTSPGSSSSSSSSSTSIPSWIRRQSEYHVQSHQFEGLTANSRYEVIVQSKNRFGWSEPAKSFVFSTRLKDYSPKPFASHPSFQDGLASSSSMSSISASTVSSVLAAAAASVLLITTSPPNPPRLR